MKPIFVCSYRQLPIPILVKKNKNWTQIPIHENFSKFGLKIQIVLPKNPVLFKN